MKKIVPLVALIISLVSFTNCSDDSSENISQYETTVTNYELEDSKFRVRIEVSSTDVQSTLDLKVYYGEEVETYANKDFSFIREVKTESKPSKIEVLLTNQSNKKVSVHYSLYSGSNVYKEVKGDFTYLSRREIFSW